MENTNRIDLYNNTFSPVKVIVDERDDGSIIVKSSQDLEPYRSNLGEALYHWAKIQPDADFICEHAPDGSWNRLTYSAAVQRVESVAQHLLDLGLSVDRPIMILSSNSINVAVLAIAAMHVGIPFSIISTAYSLISKDFKKLKYMAELLNPGLVYAEDSDAYGNAIAAIKQDGMIVVTENPLEGQIGFGSLLDTQASSAVHQAYRQVGMDTIAKILFTSGSTGMPKGVINTQRMLCSNQQSLAQVWPFLGKHRPVLLDWLPWSHTFGGNHNFHLILWHGGTLYIDEGKPTPALIDKTINNLNDVSPTVYYNVTAGYQAVLPYLEKSNELRDKFFKNLRVIAYAAAALPKNIWERLEKLSEESLGYKIPITSSWGATETAPAVTLVHYEIDGPGNIGVPMPGCTIKLVPNMGKMEIRVKGDNITPGYLNDDITTAASFDEEGFYKPGDAVLFADPGAPEKGFLFDGRIGENFKLSSGTWVHVGELRRKVIDACAPLVQDAVITGHDRDNVGVLIFPNVSKCYEFVGKSIDTAFTEVLHSPKLVEKLITCLQQYNAEYPASSTRIVGAALLDIPPSADVGEITEKGYINQRLVLENRKQVVDAIYSDAAGVIRP